MDYGWLLWCCSVQMIELYGNLQWPRMIQLLNPVVSQPLYPATFCKATEQCTTVSKVAFTRELYPKASCGELEERERERGAINKCHREALAPTGCIAAVMEHGFQPSSGEFSAVTLIKLYRNLQATFSEQSEHGPNIMTRAEKTMQDKKLLTELATAVGSNARSHRLGSWVDGNLKDLKDQCWNMLKHAAQLDRFCC